MSDLHGTARATAVMMRELADMLEEAVAEEVPAPPFEDIVQQLAVNRQPDHPDVVKRKWTWWPMREVSAITGITIHHTWSHSPKATAAYCTRSIKDRGKGYSSIQYHFWVSAGDGCPIYRCAPVEWQLWHDHTGAYPKTLSVGLAGTLHLVAPPAVQLEAAARLVVWLMDEYRVPVEQVLGHYERAGRGRTACPGWDAKEEAKPSGRWREMFYEVLEMAIEGR